MKEGEEKEGKREMEKPTIRKVKGREIGVEEEEEER